VYAFSTENWSRPDEEVEGLIAILANRIAVETPRCTSRHPLRFVGRRVGVSEELLAQMDERRSEPREPAHETVHRAELRWRTEIVDAARRFEGSTEEDFRRCCMRPRCTTPT